MPELRQGRQRQGRRTISREFELTGHVLRHHAGQNKQGQPFELLVVGGHTFFLPDHLMDRDFEEGMYVTVFGEFVGERFDGRSGRTVPQFELDEIEVLPAVPVAEALAAAEAAAAARNGVTKAS